jgi:hypothetical protein
MASIQSNINSAFNALLVAGLGGSRALSQSPKIQAFTKERSLKQASGQAMGLINQIVKEAGGEEDGVDLTQIEDINLLSDTVKGQVNRAQELVINRPTPGNVETYHRIHGTAAELQPMVQAEVSRRAGLTPEQAALEAQQRELGRRIRASSSVEEREALLSQLNELKGGAK